MSFRPSQLNEAMTFKELPMSATFHWGDGRQRASFMKVGTHHATNLTTHRLTRFEDDEPVVRGK